MDLHEIEERDFNRDGDLWDADPDVCCAAFQLGACVHTEGTHPEADEPETADEEIDRQFAEAYRAARAAAAADEPF